MSYSPPIVTSAGLSIPSYNDIFQLYADGFKSIYGQTVDLDNSSSDAQLLSILALSASDCMQAIQLAYNNRSPVTAIGAALDTLVKLNGLARKKASFSTCLVVLTGTPGTVINNGVVRDINGNNWDLPGTVTLDGGGTATVTAVCETPGAINITASGQLSIIFTPTAGWSSVNNGSNVAVVGQPVETDAQLRGRQAISVELPSITILAGTIAAIAATLGVTRYNVLENPTNATDANGLPPHSVSAVVEGGTDLDVATAIFNNRGIGPLTFGTTTVNVVDPNSGIVTPISFIRPSLVPVYVVVNAHLLSGGTSAALTAMGAAIVNYLNSLQIGERVNYASLVAAAMSVNPNPSAPIVTVESLFLDTAPAPSTTTDISMLYTQVASGVSGNITVNPV